MIPTEEINKWIAIHGSERDALNVALVRLTDNAERIRQIETDFAAYRAASNDATDNAAFESLYVQPMREWKKRAEAAEEQIQVLLAEHEALREARSRRGNCDCDACRAWKATETMLKRESK